MYLIQGRGGLEVMPSIVIGRKVGYNLDRSKQFSSFLNMKLTFIPTTNLESPPKLTPLTACLQTVGSQSTRKQHRKTRGEHANSGPFCCEATVLATTLILFYFISSVYVIKKKKLKRRYQTVGTVEVMWYVFPPGQK